MPSATVAPQNNAEVPLRKHRLSGMSKIVKDISKTENPMICSGAMFIAGLPYTPETFRSINERVQKRIIEPHPRFRCVINKNTWQEVDDMDITKHVHFTKLKEGEDIETFLSANSSKPMDNNLPLWDLTFLWSTDAKNTAVVLRIHHAMGDGLSLMLLIYGLGDNPPDDCFEGIPLRPRRKPSVILKFFYWIWIAIWLLPTCIQLCFCFGGDDENNPLKVAPPRKEKYIGWARPFPLQAFKDMSKKMRCTVNDTLASLAAGVVRNYFIELGHSCKKDVKVVIPVSLRDVYTTKLEFDNQVSSVFLALPIGKSTTKGRLRSVQTRMARLKRGATVWVVYLGTSLIATLLPSWVSSYFHLTHVSKCSLLFSNVPGKMTKMSFMGHKTQGIVGAIPLMGKIGTGITCLSYGGDCYFTVHTDRQLESVDRLPQLMEAEFIQMCCDILGDENKYVKNRAQITETNELYRSVSRVRSSASPSEFIIVSPICTADDAMTIEHGDAPPQACPACPSMLVVGSSVPLSPQEAPRFMKEAKCPAAPSLLVLSSSVNTVGSLASSTEQA